MGQICSRLGISRQNYYAQRRRRQRRRVDGDLIKQLVLEQRKEHTRMGGRKLLHVLKPQLEEAGVRIGRDRFFQELARQDLLVKALPVDYPRTTQSRHRLSVFANLVKDLEPQGPNEVYVCDITYVRTEEGFIYLSLITDRFSRKIVGYASADTLAAMGCLEALDMAIDALPDWARPVHHSDQGCQYASEVYVERLKKRNFRISMTQSNHCAENAMAERVNGILKQEYLLGTSFPTKAAARIAIDQAVMLYNTRRPHSSIGLKTPEQQHTLSLAA